MTQGSLILAAHGAGEGSMANQRIRELAATLNASGRWRDVIAAFNRGTPSFADALERMQPGRVVVVPVMTSDGYFREVVLPQALEASSHLERYDIRVTPSIGTRRELIGIVEMLAMSAVQQFGVNAAEATLLVVGHGTRRHARSGDTVRNACRVLRRRSLFHRIEAAFLDEPPLVEEYVANAEDATLIAVPFLIGGGQHAQIDVPLRLGIDVSSLVAMPICAEVRGRQVVCTQPVGSHPAIREIVEMLATQDSLSTHASMKGGKT